MPPAWGELAKQRARRQVPQRTPGSTLVDDAGNTSLRRRAISWQSAAFAATCAFVAVIPIEDVITVPGLGSIARITGAVALGLTVAAIAERRSMEPLRGGFVLIVSSLSFACASVVWSVHPDLSLDRLPTYLQLLAMSVLVWNIVQTRQRRDWVLRAYLSGAFVLAASVILNYLLGRELIQHSQHDRYRALGFDPNELGVLLALGIPMGAYFASVTRRVAGRVASLSYVPISILAILLTGSRGASISMAVALAMVPVSLQRLSAGWKIAAVVFLVLAGTAVESTRLPTLERISEIPSEIFGGTMTGRTDVWEAAALSIAERPAMGSGIGTAPSQIFQHYDTELVAHNILLSILVEQGTVGAVIFCSALITVAVQIRVYPQRDRPLYWILLATWLVAGMALSLEQSKITWILLTVLSIPPRTWEAWIANAPADRGRSSREWAGTKVGW